MTTHNIAKRFVFAIALVAAAAGAQAAALSQAGARDPFTDGARSVQEARSPYNDARVPSTRSRTRAQRGSVLRRARTLSGLDRTGVSADPARSVDPYLDGAYA
ncbi:hydroxyquinol 1,2-dioxygenase [Cupriavidus sp. UYMSc13B]|nr:hydroxyquinol 1,2-dioxygenase [Cupriavidus sp. UYMSc13B]